MWHVHTILPYINHCLGNCPGFLPTALLVRARARRGGCCGDIPGWTQVLLDEEWRYQVVPLWNWKCWAIQLFMIISMGIWAVLYLGATFWSLSTWWNCGNIYIYTYIHNIYTTYIISLVVFARCTSLTTSHRPHWCEMVNSDGPDQHLLSWCLFHERNHKIS